MALERVHGGEQPHIKLGVFKLRIPIIHYKLELPESLQAVLMVATCLGAIPILTEYLGLPYEIAWAMVIINGFMYFLHATMGDPVVPGWITPGIPLVIAHISAWEMGPQRIQAVIAVQILVAGIFLFMGITGLAKQLMSRIPRSIQAGILIGAGIVAIYNEFLPTGRFNQFPISVGAAGLLAYFILFSNTFKSLRSKNPILNKLGSFGMLPAILLGVIIGPLVAEIPVPKIEIGTFIFIPPFGDVIRSVSPFSIGFPSADMFLKAIPLALMAYTIAFGDLITSEALISSADKSRDDEKIENNPNRSNLICALRNGIMALVAPYPPLCGPIWTAVTAAVAQRYKEGRKAMDSIFSGVGTFRMFTAIYIMLFPVASLLRPVLPIALSLTMLVTGFICLSLGMSMCKTDKDRSIAGVMGCVLAVQGAVWGLIVGVILFLLVDFNFVARAKKEDTEGAAK